jgi:HK97 family phage portal protein
MGWIDTFLGRVGYVRKTAEIKDPPKWLLSAASGESVPDGGLYAAQAELYQRLSWVYTAVNYTSSFAASVSLNIKRVRGEKEKDIEHHEFEQLLSRPNPLWSRFEFLRATYAYQLLCGNAYWWLNRNSEKEKPSEMWIIPPDKIKPIPDGKLYLSGYEYQPGNGEKLILPLYQICHFKSFHPLNDFVGLSAVEPVAVTAASDMATQKWVANLYGKNNARLPGIIAYADPISDPDWEVIKRDVARAASDRSFLLMRNVGQGGVQWLQAVSSIRDMELLNGRTFSKEEIYSVFAPGLASVLSVNATEANARTGKATLIEFSIWPMLESVAQKVTNDILPAYESAQISLIAEFDDIRTTDRAMELQEMAEYGKSHTIDEIRERYYEDEPLERVTDLEGDKRGMMLPAQISPTTPIEEADEPEEPTTNMPAPMPPQPVTDGMEQPAEEAGEEQPPDQPEDEMQAELKRWERKALRALKTGKCAAVSFESTIIPADVSAAIAAKLDGCTCADDVRSVFREPGRQPATKTDVASADVVALLEAIRLGVEALNVTEAR